MFVKSLYACVLLLASVYVWTIIVLLKTFQTSMNNHDCISLHKTLILLMTSLTNLEKNDFAKDILNMKNIDFAKDIINKS